MFEHTREDDYVYICNNLKENGTYYHEIFLIYIDDCLVVGHYPEKVMISIGHTVKK